MPNIFRTIAAAAVLTIGLGSASTLYAVADQANPLQGSQTPSGMMGNGTMGPNGGAPMMGNGGMIGRMSRMMDSCSQMMQGGTQMPNSQWSKAPRG